MNRSYRFFTIGHSTRTINEFVDLLNNVEIRLVVDVRTAPRSRTNPQYNLEVLPKTLSESQIEYEHIAALGGLRGRKRDVPTEVNAFWQNRSFHNYADYAMSEDFRSGLIKLRELGHARQCAIMCSEAVWWRCHRRIIADYLIAAGEMVFHILGRNHVEEAHMTSGAKLGQVGTLIYPADEAVDSDRKAIEAISFANNLWRQIDRWANEGGAEGDGTALRND
jgi:uncharacterized protein (DUF488 family)